MTNKDSIFINNLSVDSNGKGLYKRSGKKRTLTAYLVKNMLEGTLLPKYFDEYFDTMEIVNVPNFSTHCMIIDKEGNSWIIEPGRGILKDKNTDSPYSIMTNFSIIDFTAGKEYNDNGFNRYKEVKEKLEKTKQLPVDNALQILEKVKQNGEWKTDFSMVYSGKENKIYYCYNANYENIFRI